MLSSLPRAASSRVCSSMHSFAQIGSESYDFRFLRILYTLIILMDDPIARKVKMDVLTCTDSFKEGQMEAKST
jgi:hypothetical protein